MFGPSPRPILLRLPEKMKEKYLYPILRGEKSAAFAQTEPEAGSDPGRMKTRAVRHGDHYIINGYKRFISHAKGSDFLQLVASTDPEKGSRGGLSVFIVDMDSKGLSIVRENRHMMGDVTYEIALDDVKVPAENLVGEEGQGMREAQSWISRNRVHQATHGLGVTQRCLEMIGKYAQERVTFGEPLGEATGRAIRGRRSLHEVPGRSASDPPHRMEGRQGHRQPPRRLHVQDFLHRARLTKRPTAASSSTAPWG